ncbi:bifunctional acetate--CoA ligase family protein/GNAT family N-acetyltransferase [Spirilliplanes yamanashiensis]|uniref:GNAT family N-acetyltransferase n=1 Tax=Spirilliplanes yamanashiensis TaxID=42233 RepID=A0A8J3YF27_9ACTN|nr:GNAT family N-acetyltransferase [Spirilliplanes yamanashiensis]MDP9818218.1 acyl-CoA synthetase (NDP forming)/L-amino acid N-acyltransferase YncA [Spirilliplanes yamanashiensis]GIJ06755.1 GNAT family N-acetyltransferase [Spirilliplanes yamanashiensis]
MTVHTDGVDALTTDGAIVHLRPARAADLPAVLDLYDRASPDNLRLRFFHLPGRLSLEADARRVCRAPGAGRHAVVAELPGRIVGVASYERRGRQRAEFAVFVDDEHHGRGIGTLLLEQLAAAARRRGLAELTGDVLGDNNAMLTVARDLTVGARATVDSGVVTVRVPTTSGIGEHLVDRREAHAERRSLAPLLTPRSVAVVGAGRHDGVGHQVLRALAEYGFRGPLYAVNPHAAAVAGHPSYPSLSAVPGGVDLAVVAVPAEAVPDVVADGARAGVRAVVLLSAGFADDGEAGRARQAELVRLVRAHGMRLAGPNCLGVVNTDPAVRLNAAFAPGEPARGVLGVASQSGAVGIALLENAAHDGTGISTFVSLGNKADVSGNDLLAWWLDDPDTAVVALYLESFGNPRRFSRLVRAVAHRKPVLVLKSGRSTAGRRAGLSHTAAAAASDVVVDALFRQAGVIRVDTLGDLVDAARLLSTQPLPGGNRVGVVGNAGGLNVLAADVAEPAGLLVPAGQATVNPVDLGAGATPEGCAAAIRALAGGGAVDALLVVLVATRANDLPGLLEASGAALDERPDVPAAVVVVGRGDAPRTCGARRAPVFELPERAMRALGHAARYAAWRRAPHGDRVTPDGVDPAAGRSAVQAGLTAGAGWQAYDVTSRLLNAYGIRLVDAAWVGGPRQAVAAAERIGFPVVLKSADPELVHKTESGAVALGLAGAGQVREAAARVLAAGRPGQGLLVQRTVPADVELAAGVVHDPQFGSLVMAGMGGVRADVLGDRVFRLVPLTDVDARAMWQSLRGAPLLTGYRGAPAVDTAAVEDLFTRVARLAEEHPEVAELDLNPVMAGPGGVTVVDAKLRLEPAGTEPDRLIRALTSY